MRIVSVSFALLLLVACSNKVFDRSDLTVISVTDHHLGVPAKTVQLSKEQSRTIATDLVHSRRDPAYFWANYLINIEYEGKPEVVLVNGHHVMFKGVTYKTLDNIESTLSSMLK